MGERDNVMGEVGIILINPKSELPLTQVNGYANTSIKLILQTMSTMQSRPIKKEF